jgi:hypothetical protein
MHYEVRFVGDSELPDGVDYAFARTADHTYLFMKRSAVDACPGGECEALTRSFTTWERAQSVELKELSDAF